MKELQRRFPLLLRSETGSCHMRTMYLRGLISSTWSSHMTALEHSVPGL
jgi:hypothetical protein